ncbi:conserved hypothetical protein [Xanthomonas campestris pv. raphani 756C]|nr:conserved hypothetical protein [Xanthomonas campestris pv. raphani 756C]
MQGPAQERCLVTAPGPGEDATHAATTPRCMQRLGWHVHQSDAPVDHTDASIARIDLERAKRRS